MGNGSDNVSACLATFSSKDGTAAVEIRSKSKLSETDLDSALLTASSWADQTTSSAIDESHQSRALVSWTYSKSDSDVMFAFFGLSGFLFRCCKSGINRIDRSQLCNLSCSPLSVFEAVTTDREQKTAAEILPILASRMHRSR